MQADKMLDAKGLACPLPIVRIKRMMDELDSGQVLEVHITDQGSKNDLTAWVKAGGHELIEQKEDADVFMFWIRKG